MPGRQQTRGVKSAKVKRGSGGSEAMLKYLNHKTLRHALTGAVNRAHHDWERTGRSGRASQHTGRRYGIKPRWQRSACAERDRQSSLGRGKRERVGLVERCSLGGREADHRRPWWRALVRAGEALVRAGGPDATATTAIPAGTKCQGKNEQLGQSSEDGTGGLHRFDVFVLVRALGSLHA